MQVTLTMSPRHAANMVFLIGLARRGAPPRYLLAQDRVAYCIRNGISIHAAYIPGLSYAAYLRPGQLSDSGNVGSVAQS